jgi:hypothetical protein
MMQDHVETSLRYFLFRGVIRSLPTHASAPDLSESFSVENRELLDFRDLYREAFVNPWITSSIAAVTTMFSSRAAFTTRVLKGNRVFHL